MFKIIRYNILRLRCLKMLYLIIRFIPPAKSDLAGQDYQDYCDADFLRQFI